MSKRRRKDRQEPEPERTADPVADGELLGGQEIAVAGDVLPSTLHLLPLFERPFFPIQAMPLAIDEQAWRATVELIGETASRGYTPRLHGSGASSFQLTRGLLGISM